MLNIKIITIIIVILFIIVILYDKHEEQFAGALMQLYAKGPQDMYLTGLNNRNMYQSDYIYYPYNPLYPLAGYYGYGYHRSPYLWNQPTRYKHNYAPYLLLTPDRNYLY
jgi:hypothetical protein